jgi:hypothetical protein
MWSGKIDRERRTTDKPMEPPGDLKTGGTAVNMG